MFWYVCLYMWNHHSWVSESPAHWPTLGSSVCLCPSLFPPSPWSAFCHSRLACIFCKWILTACACLLFFFFKHSLFWGFPGSLVSKESICSAGDPSSIPGFGKIPWRRKWKPTPVFLPGESHGQRCLVGYSPWGHKESDMTEQLTQSYLSEEQYEMKKHFSKNRRNFPKI